MDWIVLYYNPTEIDYVRATSDTDPGDNELAADVLHVGLDLAGDVQLMTVERDALQVDLKVTLRRWVRTLVRMTTPWLRIIAYELSHITHNLKIYLIRHVQEYLNK